MKFLMEGAMSFRLHLDNGCHTGEQTATCKAVTGCGIALYEEILVF
jgi:hypothetical protein